MKKTDATWNGAFVPYADEYVTERFKRFEKERPWKDADLTGAGVRHGETGLPWRGFDVTAKGRHWAYPPPELDRLDEEGRIYWPKKQGGWPRLKKYLDEANGVPVQDIWTDIFPLNSQSTERLGYPTQKPSLLLERIVGASSNPGDIVLDPFCGCGTAVSAAQKLGREWVGIDITHLSVSLIKARLKRDFDLVVGKDYFEIGTPKDVQSALYFAESDPYQFQFWIVGEIGAQPYGAMSDQKKGKKGGDTGIDGLMYFRTPDGGRVEKVIVSVKAGRNLNPGMVRDLRGTVEREKAAVGVFLCAHEPTRGMREEAAKAGAYRWGTKVYPKLQILTVADVLAGKQPELPRGAVNVSYEQREVKTLAKSKQAKSMDTLFPSE